MLYKLDKLFEVFLKYFLGLYTIFRISELKSKGQVLMVCLMPPQIRFIGGAHDFRNEIEYVSEVDSMNAVAAGQSVDSVYLSSRNNSSPREVSSHIDMTVKQLGCNTYSKAQKSYEDAFVT